MYIIFLKNKGLITKDDMRVEKNFEDWQENLPKNKVNEGKVTRIEVLFSFATVFSFCLKL